MAVSITNQLSNTGGSATSYSTASWTPTASDLYLATFSSRTGVSVDPNIPTASGNGLTWVQIATVLYDDTSGSRRRFTVFRALGSSPSTGSLTFDLAGQTQTDGGWIIDHVTGMDTTGTNGSGAIVQSATNANTTGATSLTVTLAAFSDANNVTFGAFGYTTGGGAITIGSGFTQLADTTLGSSSTRITTEWVAANDTTVDLSPDGSQQIGGIALEIKPPSASNTTAFFTMF